MMTVRLICPRCGQVEVDSRQCWVIPKEHDRGRVGTSCPQCQMILDKPILDDHLGLLMDGDVYVTIPDNVEELA
jgi:hypothetical protein